jgi:hypothetical protein
MEGNLNKLYPNFSNSAKMVIKNVNILHECKESRDVDQLLTVSIKISLMKMKMKIR